MTTDSSKKRKRRTRRPCEIVGDVCIVPLTQGQSAKVDAADFGRVSEHNWHAVFGCNVRAFYAQLSFSGFGGRRKIPMQQFIINAPRGVMVDHVNGDTLDNRSANLRICTNQQNTWNSRSRGGSSKFKGVCWAKKYNKWQASIQIHRLNKWLGYFMDEADAALAYDHAAVEHFGGFARLNFPEEMMVFAN